LRSQSFKLIWPANDEQVWLRQYRRQEVMARPNLLAKFRNRVHRGIQVAPQPLLGHAERADDIHESHISDHQEVNIAAARQLAARRRTEHERNRDAPAEGSQSIAEDVDDPDRLDDQSLQLAKDGRLTVRLEVNLAALDRTSKEAGAAQRVELSRNGALRGARSPDDVADVERSIRISEEQPEHTSARLPEQHGGRILDRDPRTHFEYNCTQIEYASSTARISLRGHRRFQG
jgi:hypothetical protein